MKNATPALSPVPLMQISTGFWASKTLAVANEIDLFTQIAGGKGTTPAELAKSLDVDPRPAEMLLTGCASLGLLEKKRGRYVNSPLAEEFLVRGKAWYFGGWVEMLDKRLCAGWGKLAQAVRTNRPTTWDPSKQKSLFDGVDPKLLAVFWQAMHSLSSFTARVLGQAVDLGSARKLLDVGGGSGAYDIELCRIYPWLESTVYDLEPVTQIAAENAKKAGFGDRVKTHPGDFFSDVNFPGGHDVHLFSMILHDWNEEKNRALLKKSHAALPSGGRVVVSELLVNDEKTGPVPAALMSLNMLVETEGRNYTAAEYASWLADAGFRDMRTVTFDAPGANGAVVAVKP